MKNYRNDQIFLVRQVPGEEPLQTFRYFVQRTDLVLQPARVKLGQLRRPTRVMQGRYALGNWRGIAET